jgi:hypothetical protein
VGDGRDGVDGTDPRSGVFPISKKGPDKGGEGITGDLKFIRDVTFLTQMIAQLPQRRLCFTDT